MKQELENLHAIIKNQFSFNKSLQGILAKKICQRKDRTLSSFQQKIIAEITQNKIATFQEIWDRIEQKQKESSENRKVGEKSQNLTDTDSLK